MTLKKTDKIYVAGHKGLVGQALVKTLVQKGYKNIVTRTRDELDLLNGELTLKFLKQEKPNVIFIAAAKVGGIQANNTYRADFLFENLSIQNNLIWGAHKSDVENLILLGSSCIYPKFANQPIKEESLLTGPLEETNRPYAIAKIAGLELVQTLRTQYNRKYFSVMPTNLFGPGDNFDLETSHVMPALIRKFVNAKRTNQSQVIIWGSGTPLREFMYSEDCADAIIHITETCENQYFERIGCSFLNIGTGEEISIKDLALEISKIVNFNGELFFDSSKPDGTPRKIMDSSKLYATGWKPKFSFTEALRLTIQYFENNYLGK